MASAAQSANTTTDASSASSKSSPPAFSVRYTFPHASPRIRIGTPRKLRISGWAGGKPYERGCAPRSCRRSGLASSMRIPRIPRPRGRSPMAWWVSWSMPTVRNCASSLRRSSRMPSAAYWAPVSSRARSSSRSRTSPRSMSASRPRPASSSRSRRSPSRTRSMARTLRSRRRDVHEASLERVTHQLGARGQPQLLLDVRAVRLDGAHGEVQLLADLGVRVSERDQAQDVDLARGQIVGRALGGGGERGAEARMQIRLALTGEPYGVDELVVGRLLEDVAQRARAQGMAGEGGVLLHRQDDDARAGRRLADLGDDVERLARARHVEVEDEDVGLVAAHVAQGVVRGTGHRDDLEVVLALQQQLEARPHDGVVVGEHDRHGHPSRSYA